MRACEPIIIELKTFRSGYRPQKERDLNLLGKAIRDWKYSCGEDSLEAY